jgi:hypothetical protein
VAAAVGVVLLSVLVEPAREAARSARLALGGDHDAYMNGKTYGSGFNAHHEYAAARYLSERLRPGEPFAFWGLASDLSALADRPLVSRFVHSDPLRFGVGPLADTYRLEYLAAFDAARPRYYVFPGGASDSVATGTMRTQFPALIARLDSLYAFDAAVPGYVVLRRKAGT